MRALLVAFMKITITLAPSALSPESPPKHTQSTLTALHPTFCLVWFLVCGRSHCFSSLLERSLHWSSAPLPSALSQCPLLPLIKGSPVFSLYIFDIFSGGLSGGTSYLPRYQMFFLIVLCLQSCIKFEQSAPTHFFLICSVIIFSEPFGRMWTFPEIPLVL